MKQSKRINQFKIRVSDDFLTVLDKLTHQNHKSQSDIIHIALGQYARNVIRDYITNEKFIESIEETRNTRKPRKKSF